MTDTATAPRDITNRRVLKIALPIMLSNVTIPILGAVDTGVVGQMGQAAPIGAVGIGAVVLSAIYWIFGFLRMGTSGLAAQALGQGNRAEVAALLTRVLLIGFAGGVVIILLQVPILWAAFWLSPASAEVESLARGYMQIRIWSAPAAIAVFGITGWLIAQERTRAVLVLQLWMNGINVVLNVWFVLGIGWGVNGVALATFLAEWSGMAMGLYLCRAAFRVPAWRDWARVFDRVKLVQMAQVNSDILIRSLLLQVIFLSFLFVAADFRRCDARCEPGLVAIPQHHLLRAGRLCFCRGSAGRAGGWSTRGAGSAPRCSGGKPVGLWRGCVDDLGLRPIRK